MLIPGHFLVLIGLIVTILLIAIVENYESANFLALFASLAMCGISVFALFRDLLYSKFTFWGETFELKLRATDVISAIFKRPSEEVTKVLETFDLEFADLIQDLPQEIKTYAVLFGVLVILLIISAIIHFFKTFSTIFSQNLSKKAHVFSLISFTAYWLFSLVLRKEVQAFVDEWSSGLVEIPVETHTFLPVLLGGILLAVILFLRSDSLRSALQRTPATTPSISNNNAPAVNPATTKEQDNIALLKQYKKLLDDGVITEEEFQQKKSELLK